MANLSKTAVKGKPARKASAGRVAAQTPESPKKAATSRAKHAATRYVPGPLIDSEAALADATARLLALDPQVIGRLLEGGGPPPLRRQEPGFAGLAAIIVSQQVSVASANAIFGRLEERVAPLAAQSVLDADEATLRGCGLSAPKMRAIRALAGAVAHAGLDLGALGAMDAALAHEKLVGVHGVGPWTADIFLLFCLGHPDAFPAGDLALQEAARLALGLKKRPDARRLGVLAERWRPLRGVAARMLWAYYRFAKQRSGMALASG